MRGFQPHRDTTDWTSDAIRAVFDSWDQSALVSRGDDKEVNNAGPDPDVGSHRHHHPSMYLRVALGMDPSIGDKTDSDPSATLRRLLATATLRRVEPVMAWSTRRKQPSSSSSSSSPASSGRAAAAAAAAAAAQAAHDESSTAQLRIAEWMQQDQAISYGVQLGILPSDLPPREAGISPPHEKQQQPAGPGGDNQRGDAQAQAQAHAQAQGWRESLMARAFSAAGDDLERKLLEVFTFRDEPPGLGPARGGGYLGEETAVGGRGGRGWEEVEVEMDGHLDDGEMGT